VSVPKGSKDKPFSLLASTLDDEGNKWDIEFTYVSLKRGYRANVKAKCTSKRAPILDARNHSNMILDLWPIEYWPEFARSLAYQSANGNDGSIQEGLF